MEWVFARIREWFILIIGLALLIGGFAATSLVQRRPSEAPVASENQSTLPSRETLTGKGSKEIPETRATERTALTSAGAATATEHHTVAQQPSAPKRPTVSGPRTASPQPTLSAEATAGSQVFRKCQACHSLQAGKNGIGPSLANIIGKKTAGVEGYNYSQAMKSIALTWDEKTLDAYLTDPQKVVPGNKMPFPGLKTENERKGLLAYLAASASSPTSGPASATAQAQPAKSVPALPQASTQAATPSGRDTGTSYIPAIRYTLRSGIAEGRMVFIGIGGTIDGQTNPVLSAAEGQLVQVTLINGEGAEHDIVFDSQGPAGSSPHVFGKGASTNIAFVASKAGDYVYFCSVPGHRLAGMEGQFLITPQPPPQTVTEADISHVASDVPKPIGKREPQTVRVDLVTVELEGRLAEGTTFGYWTFNGKVPGPMLRVRVGDTVEVHLKNADNSAMVHSVDFHAATGPGGGAVSTQTNPGEEKSFKFKALTPGLYVYHCATPMVAHHIANGMYGLILVEPEEGLPAVDHEFYVMQGEIYTEGAFGQHGSQEFNVEKLLNERPEYFVFNGSVGALSRLHPLRAKVGDTVRIFFGVGGPNHTSSFHVIGEIFDKVYNLGGVLSEPLRGVQTVTVPAGGAVITEFKVDVPGNYTLVDHALSRAERGLVGILHVEGPPNSEIYDGKIEPGSGH
ncbi:nitrite reductase [Pseudolabrys sp. Root1462]|uniref:copper-containing nitrite reductase n=1 Tax=Pseudolabrys sp. Root1462 TaxID=1736466 RepID=UPI0007027C1B|nr:copper-containing nitrite reductase [Pseudolabrys sp. Root1462]KQY99403.1 nitrite reductase [Pseudolabrys sp. Root1462]